MGIPITQQLEFILRLVVAGLCGAIIGFERENHMKTAGIKTHLIVSMAAALMMIVSKYGFIDSIADGLSVDVSRIAAGAVTAIGFLGAGVIFVRNQSVSGITTAAGIWATVGVGVAIGAGMYIIGIVASVLIILVHVIFNKNSRLIKDSMDEFITLVFDETEDFEDLVATIFATRNIEIVNFRVKRLIDEDAIEVRLYVRYPETYKVEDIIALFKEVPNIRTIEI